MMRAFDMVLLFFLAALPLSLLGWVYWTVDYGKGQMKYIDTPFVTDKDSYERGEHIEYFFSFVRTKPTTKVVKRALITSCGQEYEFKDLNSKLLYFESVEDGDKLYSNKQIYIPNSIAPCDDARIVGVTTYYPHKYHLGVDLPFQTTSFSIK